MTQHTPKTARAAHDVLTTMDEHIGGLAGEA